jgi:exopolyphosphatase/pppGpp-phosphohydrolase
MRGAVIDLGSNTFHTLVAEVDRFGIVQVVHDEKVAVRLGED